MAYSAAMRLAFISDTHGLHRRIKRLPKCDILFHCGDLSGKGDYSVYQDIVWWFDQTDAARYYVIIPGNHDMSFERDEETSRSFFDRPNIKVLINQGAVIEGLKIWGSPMTPRFFDWAFNVDRGEKIAKFWEKIPEGLDVLVTHGPSMNTLDFVGGQHVGCEMLAERLNVVKPKIHAFGHIHEGAGVSVDDQLGITSINASILDGRYQLAHKPVVLDYEDGIVNILQKW